MPKFNVKANVVVEAADEESAIAGVGHSLARHARSQKPNKWFACAKVADDADTHDVSVPPPVEAPPADQTPAVPPAAAPASAASEK